jgi:hypothetical protein
MARALSADLRNRVVAAIAGGLPPVELPPSERSNDYESLDQGRDD